MDDPFSGQHTAAELEPDRVLVFDFETLGTTGPVEAYAVTRDGDVVWHVTIGGLVARMYRATPLDEF